MYGTSSRSNICVIWGFRILVSSGSTFSVTLSINIYNKSNILLDQHFVSCTESENLLVTL